MDIVKDGMTLVDEATGKPLQEGQYVTTSRGETLALTGGSTPHKSSSTGRVWVVDPKSKMMSEYFPSVISARWVDSDKVGIQERSDDEPSESRFFQVLEEAQDLIHNDPDDPLNLPIPEGRRLVRKVSYEIQPAWGSVVVLSVHETLDDALSEAFPEPQLQPSPAESEADLQAKVAYLRDEMAKLRAYVDEVLPLPSREQRKD